MIACVSPADYNMDETVSTLRYADRAKQIKNKPIVNQDPKTAEINKLNLIIQQLRLDLLNIAAANTENGSAPESIQANVTRSPYVARVRNTVVDQKLAYEEFRKNEGVMEVLEENEVMRRKLEMALHDMALMEHQLIEAETTNDDLRDRIDELKSKVVDMNLSFDIDTCPAEIVQQSRGFVEVKNMICSIAELCQKNQNTMSEMLTTQANAMFETPGTPGCLSADGDPVNCEEEIKLKVERFTKKHLDYRTELHDLKQQLALKEEHHRKLYGNFSNFCSFEEEFKADGKIKDYETIIQNLETEKEALLRETQKNKSTVISAKLAEDRRKRVKELEQEIANMQKKNKHQALLLKQREKDTEKITVLQNDIKDMKQKKVKLIRTMKAESEEFRQWKMIREKEMVQLREKDRKRQNEMVKKQMLHDKQRNVLKRKVEEGMAINKRLKDALDKHKTAQAGRKKPSSTSGRVDHINGWMEQELEVIISVIDAKQSLEQLIEDRGVIGLRLTAMKKSKLSDKSDIEALEEDMNMRNAQITDLRDKIKSSDIEAKTKNICEGLNSMPESKAAVKYLFTSIGDLRTEYVSSLSKFQEYRANSETEKEKTTELENKMRDQIEKLRLEKNQTERDYEEKIAVLLRELRQDGGMDENSKGQQIQQEELEKLREKIERYEKEIEELKSRGPVRRTRNYEMWLDVSYLIFI